MSARTGKLIALSLALPALAQANDDFFGNIEVTPKDTEVGRHDGRLQILQQLKYGLQPPDPNFAFERDEPGWSQVETRVFGEVYGELSSSVSYRLSAKMELDMLTWHAGEPNWEANNNVVLLKDAYLDKVFDNQHWLRVGNQVFAWGESETLAITDVLAPTDQTEFAQVELQDIRLQIPAVLYSLPFAGGKLSSVLTWDAGFNRYADEDEEFYPYIQLKTLGLQTVDVDPEQQWEAALRYTRFFNGGDVSLVLAQTNSNEQYGRPHETAPLWLLEQVRVNTLGISANRVKDSWLFKTELGYNEGQAFNTDQGYVESDEWRGMAGAEYSGLDDWYFSLEVTAIYANAPPDSVASSNVRSLGQTLQIQRTALNERLTNTLWLFQLLQDNGQVLRWNIDYDWSDHWAFSGAVVLYSSEDSSAQLYPFRYNDTFNLSVQYSF